MFKSDANITHTLLLFKNLKAQIRNFTNFKLHFQIQVKGQGFQNNVRSSKLKIYIILDAHITHTLLFKSLKAQIRNFTNFQIQVKGLLSSDQRPEA